MPSGYNTSYNVVQQSCKMRYAQNIRAQFKPTESINITGGNSYNNAVYLNSQSCKRLLNNFSGMPEAPIITGYDIYYSFEYVTFNISVQPNIKPDKITIYYYNQVINDITITGSNELLLHLNIF